MRRVRAAADEVLANETITREAAETITESLLLERYRRDYAGKPGPEEVHVRIMLSMTETEAADLIAKVKAGGDFAAIAKQFSKDTSASVGGDLGFLPRDGLNVEVGAVAFALPPGGMTAYPVRAATGWFVVKVEARRSQPTQQFTVVREAIKQAMVREGAFARIKAALAEVIVHEYSMAGKEGIGALPALD
jgi:parvulin-like peptidyl-prolyl isomerase